MKAVICAIAKFEYNYIYEWVEYHLNLGFDKIVIYDNNDYTYTYASIYVSKTSL